MSEPVVAQRGIGLQLNATVLVDLGVEALEQAGVHYDFAEILCDVFAGPLDTGYELAPENRGLLEELQDATPLIAHGNFGAEFGFDPIRETACVRRHLEVARAISSPWYSDHMFFGDRAVGYMWSSPLQFSKAEVERVADRARTLQDIFGIPICHENAFYYAPFPGSTMAEADFVAAIVDRAGTYLHLDLHNIYANSQNFEGYDPWSFLRTIPLDRVIEIHIAGGQMIDGWYHDLHSQRVPETVWEMLDWVIPRADNLSGVCLEVQGPAHTAKSRRVSPEWSGEIRDDLDRARELWNKHRAT